MPSVRNLTDILQLIVHGLDERPFPQEQCVPEAHHTIFHVLPDFCEQFEPLAQEEIMQGLGDIAPVPKELATQPGGESLDGLTVVDIAWRQHERPAVPLRH